MADTIVKLSVVICTHNPREANFRRVLDSLKGQTLPAGEWELLLIDNASAEPLAERYDLSWHPSSRHVREDELGLTPARLRGMAEATGDVLLFVDDDNVLAADYLATGMAIGESHRFLGAWGAGILTPEFETEPEDWARPHLVQLALRHHDVIYWSNNVSDWPATPVGAGMFVRAEVAARYVADLKADPSRVALDRRGDSLDGAGDLDLAYTARHFDMGWGTFPALSLFHLIPAGRVTEAYLLRITEAANASLVRLGSKVGRPSPERMGRTKVLARGMLALVRGGPVRLRFFKATQAGINRGLRDLDAKG